MNPELPESAVAFAASARRAFDDLGGIAFARRAEADPRLRSDAASALEALGADDLGPVGAVDIEQAAAAAMLCREAGRVVLPWPIEGMLLRDDARAAGSGDRPFAVVSPRLTRIDHGDCALEWDVATLDGAVGIATATSTGLGTRLGPFCVDGTLAAPLAPRAVAASSQPVTRRTAWWLTLTAWRVLGGCERAVELAAQHTSQRVQFDKPLTAFQTVRFALADASVAVHGLDELARFTLWRLATCDEAATADALALRCHAVDVARDVLRATQHLHGAAGMCDDYDISILTRHLQPALRLPESADATALRLADEISRDGFDGLFRHGGAA